MHTISTLSATADAATNDPLADFPHIDFARFVTEVTTVRGASKTAILDPLNVTAEDLIVGNDLELDGYPLFELPETMLNNGFLGPIFVCSKGLFRTAGRLTDTFSIFAPQTKTTGTTPWEHACELLSKHHVPEPRWHADGHCQWPRLRPAMAAGQVAEVWIAPCDWAKRMFLIGWALQNPYDNNARWFYRNPDLACLRIRDWVPEKVALP